MVTSTYMTEHRPKPSAAKRFLDQTMMPAAIDAAGAMEAGLERVAVAVRQRPATVLALAVGLGAAVPLLLLLRPRRRRRLFG